MSTELLILLVAILVAVVIVVWRYLQYRDMQTWHRSEYSSLRTQLRERQEQEIEASASEPPSLVRKTIIVNTRDGRTIRGVLMSEHDDRITLAEAFFMAGNGEHQLAGQTHVPRENISFLQEVVLTQQSFDYEEADR
jgi:hypothetical protein